MARDIEKLRVVTVPFTANFVNVFEAVAYEDGDPEFALVATFEPNDPGLKPLKAAAGAAMKEKFGEDAAKWPKGWRKPFRDGNEKPEWPGFEGKIYVKFSNKKSKPGLVDQNLNDIIDKTKFYSGCICRCEVIAYAYDTKGNRGVAFGLYNIQKVADGERLGGSRPANTVFDKISGGEAAEDTDEFDATDDDLNNTAEDDIDETPPPPKKKTTQPSAKKRAAVDVEDLM